MRTWVININTTEKRNMTKININKKLQKIKSANQNLKKKKNTYQARIN